MSQAKPYARTYLQYTHTHLHSIPLSLCHSRHFGEILGTGTSNCNVPSHNLISSHERALPEAAPPPPGFVAAKPIRMSDSALQWCNFASGGGGGRV